MKKYVVEFIGTFFLVLTVWLASKYAGNLAALAIWSVLMVMVYAGGHISGGHYNPAVTLGVLVRWKTNISETIMYWISQILGGIVAALVVVFLAGNGTATAIASDMTWKVITAEALFTFALVWTVLHTATTRSNNNNSFFGLAIWFIVLVGALSVGAISGGAFNPAVALGGIFDGTFAASTVWMHLVGQVLGALVAAIVFNYVYVDRRDEN